MKNTLVRVLDIFLTVFSIIIVCFFAIILLPWLYPKRGKPLDYASRKNRLFLLAEAASYDALKKKGNLLSLKMHLSSGYFESVHIVHFPTKKKRTISLGDGLFLIEIKSFPRRMKESGFNFSYTILSAIRYFWNIFLMRKFVRREMTILRGAGTHHTALAALFLQRLTGIPACISVHSDDEKRYGLMKKYGSFWKLFNNRWFTVQVHKFIFSHALRVFLVRESLKDWAIRMGADPGRIRIFPHGVKINDFTKSVKREDEMLLQGASLKKLVVFAGRLSQENYVYDVIEIAALVLKKLSNAVFMVIGDGPERNALEKLVRQKQLEDRVRFTGFLPQAKVIEFRGYADVNLCLMGGFSLIEAALSGKPVVSYDVEWHYELVKNNETGFLVRETDVSAAAEAIIALINDEHLAMRLGENARGLAMERHDVQKIDRIKAGLYDELKEAAI